MAKLTYCSFADDDKCRGVVVLKGALDPMLASIRCHALRINPGGQLWSTTFETTDADVPESVARALEQNTDRLLTAAEAMLLFDAASLGALEGDEKAING
mgnify:FL=1